MPDCNIFRGVSVTVWKMFTRNYPTRCPRETFQQVLRQWISNLHRYCWIPLHEKKYPSSIFSHNQVRFSIIRSKMFILYVVITILDRDTNCFLKTISIYIWLYISRPVYKHSIFYKRYITMLQEDIISLASFIRHRLLCKASYVCHAFII